MTAADGPCEERHTGEQEFPGARRRRPISALLEVVICSSYPTQILIIYFLAAAGFQPTVESTARLSLVYVVALALGDSLLLIALILFFLRLHGESPKAVFLSNRPIVQEAWRGVLLIPVVFMLVVAAMLTMQRFAPWLHNVASNPLEELVRRRSDAIVFGIVAIVAGGIREEIQRAFILFRFEEHLGGAYIGLLFFSVLFGAGHIIQGWDAAITTGLLGVLWGFVYLRRRSIVAPVISHAGFNAAEIMHFASLIL